MEKHSKINGGVACHRRRGAPNPTERRILYRDGIVHAYLVPKPKVEGQSRVALIEGIGDLLKMPLEDFGLLMRVFLATRVALFQALKVKEIEFQPGVIRVNGKVHLCWDIFPLEEEVKDGFNPLGLTSKAEVVYSMVPVIRDKVVAQLK